MKRFLAFLLLVILAVLFYLFYFLDHAQRLDLHTHLVKYPPFSWFMRSQADSTSLEIYGNVDIRQVDLGFRVNGRVQAMLFEEGNFVPQGKLMAFLDKQPYVDLVREEKARIESTRVSLENANKLVGRRGKLLGTGGISPQEVDDAISSRDVFAATLTLNEASLGVAETNLQDTELYSPSDGILLTRIREPGTVVRESDPIYTLSILSPVWVRTYVTERQLGLIAPDMPVEIYTDIPGGIVYRGHIGFISPVAEFTPKTVETTQLRTDLVYRLRAIVDNPDYALKQGMPVTVKIPDTNPRPSSQVWEPANASSLR